ncbi:hypothetical protein [Micromonospora sp. NPDC005220]|uniref:hypothetical protein n=1 Tax=Micromonospora sp. NPDC005220 TaxID=3155589 RepID=UPI0033B275ED
MTEMNGAGTGHLSEEDLKVLIGVAAHLELIFVIDEGPQEVIDALLTRLRRDLVRLSLVETDSKAELRDAVRGLNMRMRRALGEDLPSEDTA